MPKHSIQNILPTIPTKPGVYTYFDADDNILYIGKAKNLRKRVSSYFNKIHDNNRLRLLVKKIDRVEFTVVETESDALLLENTLIKQKQPKYNINLKDDKSYPYICIKNERFPRVFLTRQRIKDGSEYFGPYTTINRVKAILSLLHSIFQLRTCSYNLSEQNIANNKYKVCLEYHIGNCKGPCEGLQSEAEYNLVITQVRDILKGNVKEVINYVEELMHEYAAEFNFEKAQDLKEKLVALKNYQHKSTVVNDKINNVDVFNIENTDKNAFISFLKVVNGAIIQAKVIQLKKQLNETDGDLLSFGITTLRQEFNSHSPEIIIPQKVNLPDQDIKITVPQRGDKRKLLSLAKKNAYYYYKQQAMYANKRKKLSERQFEVLKRLQSDLQLPALPVHIECFDNSNLQGSNPVSAMVLFRNGKPSNKEYRHYHIKTVTGPDDFASMEEVVYRRYKRLKAENLPLPNLIVIDGGKGQLSASVKSLQRLDLLGKIPIIGIAKRLEEIYKPGDPLPLHIDKRSPSLKLIQHLRNEAHRFAITFHRKIRAKNTFNSELEKIPGVGEKTANKLLTHFKSVNAIKQASQQDLLAIVNNKVAKSITTYFTTNEAAANPQIQQ